MVSSAPTQPSRRLGAALEPVIGQVYFAPEAHAAYAELGFDTSRVDFDGVAAPDGDAYFTSRGSLLGQAPGEVVAAAFGVFSIDVVVPAVTRGWERTDAPTIRSARDLGGLGQLERLLGAEPEGLAAVEPALLRAIDGIEVGGRTLAAGALAREAPDHPLGEVFRAGDVLREHRGDSHIASWVAAGLTPIEIGLLTERYWGLPLRTYSRTRGWTDAQYDAAEEGLAARGLLADGDFTDAGRDLRERIEVDTDRQMEPVVARIGDDLEPLLAVLSAWGAAVREGKGYPRSGPHDLARDLARDQPR
jgi:hypothetical protein